MFVYTEGRATSICVSGTIMHPNRAIVLEHKRMSRIESLYVRMMQLNVHEHWKKGHTLHLQRARLVTAMD